MAERVLGEEISVSVATALALEAQVAKEDVAQRVDAVFLNLRTLWRNFANAYDRNDRPHIRELLTPFVEEIMLIQGIIRHGGVHGVVYYPHYTDPGSTFPNAELKEHKTENQQRVLVEEKIAMDFVRNLKELQITECKYRLPQLNGRVWILSHHPIDLLSRYSFSNMMLLESHTGVLKGPLDWNSKLSTNEAYSRIPFNEMTLQVFGDGYLLKGKSLKYKKVLQAVASQNSWTPLTTKDKITLNLKAWPDQEIAQELLSLYKIRYS